jgi:prevent-host-death family protein
MVSKDSSVNDRGQVRTFTVSELNQHTADVLREINESRRPALVTRHGRFVAMITPLEGVPVESILLSLAGATRRASGRRTGSEMAEVMTSEEMAERYGFELP